MGRIKTTTIKRITNKIINDYGDIISNNFNHNKRLIQSITDVESKKVRNIVAGYVTRLRKRA